MSRRGILLFATMSVVWGIPYLFIRIAVGELTPGTLVFARTVLGAAILVPIALRRGGWASLRAAWLPLLAFTGIEIGLPWLLLAGAEQHLSSSLTGLLLSAVPLVATVIGLILRTREGTGPAGFAGLLLGLAGVALIVGLDAGTVNWPAIAAMGVVAICYAIGPVILTRGLAGVPSVSVMAAALGLCAIAFAPVALVQAPHHVPGAPVVLSILVLASVCTALAFIVFSALIEEIGPVRATVITYVNPAVAAVLGVAVLGERFTIAMGAGFALVLAGSALATRRRPAAPPKPG